MENRYISVREAVSERIIFLLKENGYKSVYEFAHKNGINYDTVRSVVGQQTTSGVNFATVIQIAHGFGMTIAEFTDDPIFHEDNLKF